MANEQAKRDKRIQELHAEAKKHWPQLEKIIDELKSCGPHSQDGNNALANVRQWLRDLSTR
ncbi:MAG: hypothetical protein ACK4F8_11610 [Aquabacterium sp.]